MNSSSRDDDQLSSKDLKLCSSLGLALSQILSNSSICSDLHSYCSSAYDGLPFDELHNLSHRVSSIFSPTKESKDFLFNKKNASILLPALSEKVKFSNISDEARKSFEDIVPFSGKENTTDFYSLSLNKMSINFLSAKVNNVLDADILTINDFGVFLKPCDVTSYSVFRDFPVFLLPDENGELKPTTCLCSFLEPQKFLEQLNSSEPFEILPDRFAVPMFWGDNSVSKSRMMIYHMPRDALRQEIPSEDRVKTFLTSQKVDVVHFRAKNHDFNNKGLKPSWQQVRRLVERPWIMFESLRKPSGPSSSLYKDLKDIFEKIPRMDPDIFVKKEDNSSLFAKPIVALKGDIDDFVSRIKTTLTLLNFCGNGGTRDNMNTISHVDLVERLKRTLADSYSEQLSPEDLFDLFLKKSSKRVVELISYLEERKFPIIINLDLGEEGRVDVPLTLKATSAKDITFTHEATGITVNSKSPKLFPAQEMILDKMSDEGSRLYSCEVGTGKSQSMAVNVRFRPPGNDVVALPSNKELQSFNQLSKSFSDTARNFNIHYDQLFHGMNEDNFLIDYNPGYLDFVKFKEPKAAQVGLENVFLENLDITAKKHWTRGVISNLKLETEKKSFSPSAKSKSVSITDAESSVLEKMFCSRATDDLPGASTLLGKMFNSLKARLGESDISVKADSSLPCASSGVTDKMLKVGLVDSLFAVNDKPVILPLSPTSPKSLDLDLTSKVLSETSVSLMPTNGHKIFDAKEPTIYDLQLKHIVNSEIISQASFQEETVIHHDVKDKALAIQNSLFLNSIPESSEVWMPKIEREFFKRDSNLYDSDRSPNNKIAGIRFVVQKGSSEMPYKMFQEYDMPERRQLLSVDKFCIDDVLSTQSMARLFAFADTRGGTPNEQFDKYTLNFEEGYLCSKFLTAVMTTLSDKISNSEAEGDFAVDWTSFSGLLVDLMDRFVPIAKHVCLTTRKYLSSSSESISSACAQYNKPLPEGTRIAKERGDEARFAASSSVANLCESLASISYNALTLMKREEMVYDLNVKHNIQLVRPRSDNMPLTISEKDIWDSLGKSMTTRDDGTPLFYCRKLAKGEENKPFPKVPDENNSVGESNSFFESKTIREQTFLKVFDSKLPCLDNASSKRNAKEDSALLKDLLSRMTLVKSKGEKDDYSGLKLRGRRKVAPPRAKLEETAAFRTVMNTASVGGIADRIKDVIRSVRWADLHYESSDKLKSLGENHKVSVHLYAKALREELVKIVRKEDVSILTRTQVIPSFSGLPEDYCKTSPDIVPIEYNSSLLKLKTKESASGMSSVKFKKHELSETNQGQTASILPRTSSFMLAKNMFFKNNTLSIEEYHYWLKNFFSALPTELSNLFLSTSIANATFDYIRSAAIESNLNLSNSAGYVKSLISEVEGNDKWSAFDRLRFNIKSKKMKELVSIFDTPSAVAKFLRKDMRKIESVTRDDPSWQFLLVLIQRTMDIRSFKNIKALDKALIKLDHPIYDNMAQEVMQVCRTTLAKKPVLFCTTWRDTSKMLTVLERLGLGTSEVPMTVHIDEVDLLHEAFKFQLREVNERGNAGNQDIELVLNDIAARIKKSSEATPGASGATPAYTFHGYTATPNNKISDLFGCATNPKAFATVSKSSIKEHSQKPLSIFTVDSIASQSKNEKFVSSVLKSANLILPNIYVQGIIPTRRSLSLINGRVNPGKTIKNKVKTVSGLELVTAPKLNVPLFPIDDVHDALRGFGVMLQNTSGVSLSFEKSCPNTKLLDKIEYVMQDLLVSPGSADVLLDSVLLPFEGRAIASSVVGSYSGSTRNTKSYSVHASYMDKLRESHAVDFFIPSVSPIKVSQSLGGGSKVPMRNVEDRKLYMESNSTPPIKLLGTMVSSMYRMMSIMTEESESVSKFVNFEHKDEDPMIAYMDGAQWLAASLVEQYKDFINGGKDVNLTSVCQAVMAFEDFFVLDSLDAQELSLLNRTLPASNAAAMHFLESKKSKRAFVRALKMLGMEESLSDSSSKKTGEAYEDVLYKITQKKIATIRDYLRQDYCGKANSVANEMKKFVTTKAFTNLAQETYDLNIGIKSGTGEDAYTRATDLLSGVVKFTQGDTTDHMGCFNISLLMEFLSHSPTVVALRMDIPSFNDTCNEFFTLMKKYAGKKKVKPASARKLLLFAVRAASAAFTIMEAKSFAFREVTKKRIRNSREDYKDQDSPGDVSTRLAEKVCNLVFMAVESSFPPGAVSSAGANFVQEFTEKLSVIVLNKIKTASQEEFNVFIKKGLKDEVLILCKGPYRNVFNAYRSTLDAEKLADEVVCAMEVVLPLVCTMKTEEDISFPISDSKEKNDRDRERVMHAMKELELERNTGVDELKLKTENRVMENLKRKIISVFGEIGCLSAKDSEYMSKNIKTNEFSWYRGFLGTFLSMKNDRTMHINTFPKIDSAKRGDKVVNVLFSKAPSLNGATFKVTPNNYKYLIKETDSVEQKSPDEASEETKVDDSRKAYLSLNLENINLKVGFSSIRDFTGNLGRSSNYLGVTKIFMFTDSKTSNFEREGMTDKWIGQTEIILGNKQRMLNKQLLESDEVCGRIMVNSISDLIHSTEMNKMNLLVSGIGSTDVLQAAGRIRDVRDVNDFQHAFIVQKVSMMKMPHFVTHGLFPTINSLLIAKLDDMDKAVFDKEEDKLLASNKLSQSFLSDLKGRDTMSAMLNVKVPSQVSEFSASRGRFNLLCNSAFSRFLSRFRANATFLESNEHAASPLSNLALNLFSIIVTEYHYLDNKLFKLNSELANAKRSSRGKLTAEINSCFALYNTTVKKIKAWSEMIFFRPSLLSLITEPIEGPDLNGQVSSLIGSCLDINESMVQRSVDMAIETAIKTNPKANNGDDSSKNKATSLTSDVLFGSLLKAGNTQTTSHTSERSFTLEGFSNRAALLPWEALLLAAPPLLLKESWSADIGRNALVVSEILNNNNYAFKRLIRRLNAFDLGMSKLKSKGDTDTYIIKKVMRREISSFAKNTLLTLVEAKRFYDSIENTATEEIKEKVFCSLKILFSRFEFDIAMMDLVLRKLPKESEIVSESALRDIKLAKEMTSLSLFKNAEQARGYDHTTLFSGSLLKQEESEKLISILAGDIVPKPTIDKVINFDSVSTSSTPSTSSKVSMDVPQKVSPAKEESCAREIAAEIKNIEWMLEKFPTSNFDINDSSMQATATLACNLIVTLMTLKEAEYTASKEQKQSFIAFFKPSLESVMKKNSGLLNLFFTTDLSMQISHQKPLFSTELNRSLCSRFANHPLKNAMQSAVSDFFESVRIMTNRLIIDRVAVEYYPEDKQIDFKMPNDEVSSLGIDLYGPRAFGILSKARLGLKNTNELLWAKLLTSNSFVKQLMSDVKSWAEEITKFDFKSDTFVSGIEKEILPLCSEILKVTKQAYGNLPTYQATKLLSYSKAVESEQGIIRGAKGVQNTPNDPSSKALKDMTSLKMSLILGMSMLSGSVSPMLQKALDELLKDEAQGEKFFTVLTDFVDAGSSNCVINHEVALSSFPSAYTEVASQFINSYLNSSLSRVGSGKVQTFQGSKVDIIMERVVRLALISKNRNYIENALPRFFATILKASAKTKDFALARAAVLTFDRLLKDPALVELSNFNGSVLSEPSRVAFDDLQLEHNHKLYGFFSGNYDGTELDAAQLFCEGAVYSGPVHHNTIELLRNAMKSESDLKFLQSTFDAVGKKIRNITLNGGKVRNGYDTVKNGIDLLKEGESIRPFLSYCLDDGILLENSERMKRLYSVLQSLLISDGVKGDTINNVASPIQRLGRAYCAEGELFRQLSETDQDEIRKNISELFPPGFDTEKIFHDEHGVSKIPQNDCFYGYKLALKTMVSNLTNEVHSLPRECSMAFEKIRTDIISSLAGESNEFCKEIDSLNKGGKELPSKVFINLDFLLSKFNICKGTLYLNEEFSQMSELKVLAKNLSHAVSLVFSNKIYTPLKGEKFNITTKRNLSDVLPKILSFANLCHHNGLEKESSMVLQNVMRSVARYYYIRSNVFDGFVSEPFLDRFSRVLLNKASGKKAIYGMTIGNQYDSTFFYDVSKMVFGNNLPELRDIRRPVVSFKAPAIASKDKEIKNFNLFYNNSVVKKELNDFKNCVEGREPSWRDDKRIQAELEELKASKGQNAIGMGAVNYKVVDFGAQRPNRKGTVARLNFDEEITSQLDKQTPDSTDRTNDLSDMKLKYSLSNRDNFSSGVGF